MVLNSVKNRTSKILRKLFLITISLISIKAMKWHDFYLILKQTGKNEDYDKYQDLMYFLSGGKEVSRLI